MEFATYYFYNKLATRHEHGFKTSLNRTGIETTGTLKQKWRTWTKLLWIKLIFVLVFCFKVMFINMPCIVAMSSIWKHFFTVLSIALSWSVIIAYRYLLNTHFKNCSNNNWKVSSFSFSNNAPPKSMNRSLMVYSNKWRKWHLKFVHLVRNTKYISKFCICIAWSSINPKKHFEETCP